MRPGIDASPAAASSSLTVGLRESSATLTRLQERQEQLVERLDLGVGEDRRPVGVDADGEVVGQQPVDVLGQRRRAVAVDDGLEIGDEDHQVGAGVLQPDAVLQGAEVVAQVQRAGRPVAGQDTMGLGLGHAVLLGVCGCPGERVSWMGCDGPLAGAARRHGWMSRAALVQPPPARVCAAAHAPSVGRAATLHVCVRGGPSRRWRCWWPRSPAGSWRSCSSGDASRRGARPRRRRRRAAQVSAGDRRR